MRAGSSPPGVAPWMKDDMVQVVRERGSTTPLVMKAPHRPPGAGEVLVRTLLTGIDGTDEEVLHDADLEFPPGAEWIVLGHECLGEVVEAPAESGLQAGDRVVPMVRHGCGGCEPCRRRLDLCTTEDYRERGIKGLDGFMRETWTDEPRKLVKVPKELGDLAVLAEPLSVVIKAFEDARRVARRVPWFDEEGGFQDKRALVAGTGSLGSLAAFLLRTEGMDVWVFDRSRSESAPARLARSIGSHHFNSEETPPTAVARDAGHFDLVLEATGAPQVVFQTLPAMAKNGVMMLLGVPGASRPVPVEADEVMRAIVMGNQAILGSVSSSRVHVEEALAALQRFRQRWGERIEAVVTHRFAIHETPEAFAMNDEDVVKKVVDWR